MKVLMLHRQQSAVGYYRTWVPARYLAAHGHTVDWREDQPYKKEIKDDPIAWARAYAKDYDVIITDRGYKWDDIGLLLGLREVNPRARMVVDFDDDFTDVPKWNRAHTKYLPGQEMREAGLGHLKLAEMTTVSTPQLAENFKDKTHSIQVALNCLDPADWEALDVCPDRESDPHIRVLYGGAAGHYGDMDEAREGLEAVIRNPPVPFRLICFGAVPAWIHELSREKPDVVLNLPWIPFDDYPQAVAWGGFDLAIAPLADHPFNACKSNIKWLEAGIQGIPFICSDVGPYAEIPDECAIKISNTPVQWAEALRNLLQDKALRASKAKAAYDAVMDKWTVDKRGKMWETILQEACARPRIESLEDTRLPTDRESAYSTPDAGPRETP